jgi:hypothetical protein
MITVRPTPSPKAPPGLTSRNAVLSIFGVGLASFTWTAQTLAQVVSDPMMGLGGAAVGSLGLTGTLTAGGIWMAKKLIEERDARLADMKEQRDSYKAAYDAFVVRALEERNRVQP